MKLSGWGKYPCINATGSSFESPSQLIYKLKQPDDYIVHAMGRSYGDSALNERVIFSRRFDKILYFNPKEGIVSCESGITLNELIDVLLPRGWFLSVTPGTRFITIGGAIASDVHGKNHHKAGCFSESVRSFELMLPDGKIVQCSRQKNRELFLATCGGMGLTGIILTATLNLQPVQSAYMNETIICCKSLKEVFDLFEEHKSATYSVAWIDCMSGGENIGRSILMLGEHTNAGTLKLFTRKPYSIPFNLPGIFLNKFSVSLFNRFYYDLHNSVVEDRLTPLDTFFYPLDKISHWNRMYGHRGFIQYQLVLPKESSFKGLRAIFKSIASTGLGSFLGVIKLLGPENDNYLSFPMEGYTLALDFKIQKKLFPFLDELDRIVLDYAGRLYLSKDARMTRKVFIKGYPGWKKFCRIRKQHKMKEKFNSIQSKRLGL